MINVEVAYATLKKQVIIPVQLQNEVTVAEAIVLSGIFEHFDELKKQREDDFSSLQVGVFSTPCSLNRQVQDGDRIEIYRSLQNDPKEMRRNRAKEMK